MVIMHVQVGDYLYGGGGPGAAFPVEPLIRFVNGESPYLAYSNGGPRMFFNIEDHTSKSTGQVDVKFQVSHLPGCAVRRTAGMCTCTRYALPGKLR